jgi:hypothetical protein
MTNAAANASFLMFRSSLADFGNELMFDYRTNVRYPIIFVRRCRRVNAGKPRPSAPAAKACSI